MLTREEQEHKEQRPEQRRERGSRDGCAAALRRAGRVAPSCRRDACAEGELASNLTIRRLSCRSSVSNGMRFGDDSTLIK